MAAILPILIREWLHADCVSTENDMKSVILEYLKDNIGVTVHKDIC
jgi:hypothetical protein